MARIQPVDRNNTDTETVEFLDSVQKSMGGVPNIISTMANSLVVGKAYIGLNHVLSTGKLSARLREMISLTVAQGNECGYCLSAHTFLGKRAGLTEDETDAARGAVSKDAKEHAALEFAEKLVSLRGRVSDEALAQVRQAGYTEGEIAEIITNVALNIFTNYFNHVADTDIDFPSVPVQSARASAE